MRSGICRDPNLDPEGGGYENRKVPQSTAKHCKYSKYEKSKMKYYKVQQSTLPYLPQKKTSPIARSFALLSQCQCTKCDASL